MIAEIAKVMDKDFFNISFSGGVRYSQVFGGQQMIIVDGKQVTQWIPGPLLEAIQKPCVINIDEIFAADPDVLLGLNSILEPGTRAIMTPIGLIKVHPECMIAACANTNGRTISAQFTGAQKADDSLNDRFSAVEMDYDPTVEAKILEGVKDKDIRVYIQNSLSTLRERCRINNINFDPSTRRIITCMRSLSVGQKKEIAFKMAFLNHLSATEKAKVNME